MIATKTSTLFESRKSFILAGRQVKRGDVIDLAEFDLPARRAETLVSARFGSFVANAAEVKARSALPSVEPHPPSAAAVPVPVVEPAAVVAEEVPEVHSAPPVSEDLPAVSTDVDSPGSTELGGWTMMSLVDEFTIQGRRELCKTFGLTVRGTKEEVVDRLLAYQSEQGDQ